MRHATHTLAKVMEPKQRSRRAFLRRAGLVVIALPCGCSDGGGSPDVHSPRVDLSASVDAARDVRRRDDVNDDLPSGDYTLDAFSPPCADPGADAPGCLAAPRGLVVGRPCDYAAYRIHPAPWTDPTAAALIGRDAGGLYARSALCTHRNCVAVPKAVTASGLICPCHFSTFDHYGRVTSAPAQQDLPSVALALRCDGQLVVDPQSPVDPAARLDV